MFIAKNQDNGKTLLLLGLTAENVKRFVAGKPMSISELTHGTVVPPGLQIVITYGETEQSIVDELKRLGAITSDTKTIMHGRG